MDTEYSEDLVEPAPAGAWRVVAFLMFIFAIYISHVMYSENSHWFYIGGFEEYNGKRLQALADIPDDGSLRVVILGDSRVKYGVGLGIDPAEVVTAPDGARIRALRISENWGVFQRFALLADDIFAARPDIIITQPEMLVRDWKRISALKYMRDQMAHNYFMVETDILTEVDPDEARAAEHMVGDRLDSTGPEAMQFRTPCLNFFKEDSFEARMDGQYNRLLGFFTDGPSARTAQAFIDAARSQGIAVVLLNTPHTEIYYKYIDKTFRPAVSAALDATVKKPGVFYIDPPHDWGNEYYCDPKHLNKKGRAELTEWLVGELEKIGAAQNLE